MTDPPRDPLADARQVDLDAVQARVDAGTEGPWAWEATGDKDNSWGVGLVIDDATEQPVRGENPQGENTLVEPVCTSDDNLADAEFIAHARSDMPAMVAELRAAREIVRLAPRPPSFNTKTAEYVAALWVYDQATGVAP